ncbi:hypothetical protein [Microbacterium candidum]|uniref:Transcriptional regulator, AbiEi antitoxin, Type IV TA system n=1 Tax=Microbacterium candidum TaxID=3041922 RepID=A0ABT7N297_9MICO|nr:hypothetical protein [Microbacterium sp. ASV49]MDL9980838.1 hypothetical protein [Microbacterium sp. ASV49]
MNLRPSPADLHLARDEQVTGSRMRRDPTWRRIRKGVYAAAMAWDALAPWDRYLVRVHAFALTHPDAVFCFESAAALLGLPVFGEPCDIHVLAGPRSPGRRHGDVVVHANVRARAVAEFGPIAITTPQETVVDLARVLPPAFGLAVVDAALRRAEFAGLAGAMQDAAERTGARGARRVEWIRERADASAESVLESVGRAAIEWWGFEAPTLQVVIRTGAICDRVDFAWPDRRVIGEADGDVKYSNDPDEARRQVLAEKRREDRLRRIAGGFVRWGWAETMALHATRDVVPVRDLLLGVGLPQVRNPKVRMLATLAANPRSIPHARLLPG